MIPDKQIIKSKALELGFSFCGIAKAEPFDNHREYYKDFIERNAHLSFHYLGTNFEKRFDPHLIMPEARSVIAVLLNYFPKEIIPEEDNFIISKYAYGMDYHLVMKKKMNDLIAFISTTDRNLSAMAFVDSGPVLEKVQAQRCGVGWQGKNTLLINKSCGSFFFIGIILTNLELQPDTPETDHCGSCEKCIQACPTGALDHPYQLNISSCIAFHTIENKDPIPEELRNKLKKRIFGCDICQDVCPYNKSAIHNNEPAFLPSTTLREMRKNDWLELTEEKFYELFHKSSIIRTGYGKLISTILGIYQSTSPPSPSLSPPLLEERGTGGEADPNQ